MFVLFFSHFSIPRAFLSFRRARNISEVPARSAAMQTAVDNVKKSHERIEELDNFPLNSVEVLGYRGKQKSCL